MLASKARPTTPLYAIYCVQEGNMPNIWVYVVGGMVAIGAIISVKSIIGNDSNPKSLSSQPAKADFVPEKVEVPKPDAIFKIFDVKKYDFALGNNNAPVTVIEYSSLTCPHCAEFHKTTFPLIKRDFIETGKIRYVYRDFPLDQLALSGSMLARCAGRNKYFAFINILFSKQANWTNDPQPLSALARIARLGGLTQKDFDGCLKNKSIADTILKQRLDGNKLFEINSTPTIIINGRRFSGGLSPKQFKAVITPLLR